MVKLCKWWCWKIHVIIIMNLNLCWQKLRCDSITMTGNEYCRRSWRKEWSRFKIKRRWWWWRWLPTALLENINLFWMVMDIGTIEASPCTEKTMKRNLTSLEDFRFSLFFLKYGTRSAFSAIAFPIRRTSTNTVVDCTPAIFCHVAWHICSFWRI